MAPSSSTEGNCLPGAQPSVQGYSRLFKVMHGCSRSFTALSVGRCWKSAGTTLTNLAGMYVLSSTRAHRCKQLTE